MMRGQDSMHVFPFLSRMKKTGTAIPAQAKHGCITPKHRVQHLALMMAYSDVICMSVMALAYFFVFLLPLSHLS